MMNYQPQTAAYSCNTLNNANINDMSPLTTSSSSTTNCNGSNINNMNNMMDNCAYYNNSNANYPQMTANCTNVTPCFDDKQMVPHSIAMDVNQMHAVQPTNYYSYSSSSANTSCRSSCDESICNDANNYIHDPSSSSQCNWFYPNDALSMNHMFPPELKTESVPEHNNNTLYTANNYYASAPITDYTKPVCNNYTANANANANANTNAYHDVSLMPFMNTNSNNANNMYHPSNSSFCPPIYNQQAVHQDNISLALSLPQMKAEPHAKHNARLNAHAMNNNNNNNNNNNVPFIKNNNFLYPCYQQKYPQTAQHLDIKQELYRSRRQVISQKHRYNIYKVQIKGSNFETLVKKLTRCGDNTRCIECNKTFLQKCHLFRHIRDCHLVKAAVHECPFCPKTFHQKSNLDTHCMTHAKDRKYSHPFKCLICAQDGKNKAFTRKSSLKRHCQAKHKHINVESEWINKQETPKWDHLLKTFVFNSNKSNKRNKE